MSLLTSADPVDVLLIGFVGGTGGISVLMMEKAIRFAARGLRTRIVVPTWDDTLGYAERCAEHGIEVLRTPLLIEQGSRTHDFLNAVRLVWRHRAPLVHYHVNEDILGQTFLRALCAFGRPGTFITVESTYFDGPPADDRWARRWRKAAARVFDRVVCVTESARQRQIRHYGLPAELVKCIPNGIDPARFGSGDATVAREALGLGAEVPLILFSSRLEPQKRPLDAVRAFHALAPEVPDAHLVFVGQGTLEDAIRAEAERLGIGSRVDMVGYRDDIPNWLAAAPVWFLPTEREGFSLAVLEAMAAGCPVVSTLCPGNDEVLVDGENALLTAVGDVPAMTAALRRVLSDRFLRARLAAGGRATAANYSLEKMVNEYLNVYAAAAVPWVPPAEAAA